jgi:hypothetical protein
MLGFTDLETAVLHAIFAETPEIQESLERQFSSARLLERENSGVGFFTTIAVPDDVPAVSTPSPLGQEVAANIVGLEHGMGFLLFMQDGRLHVLEGFTYDDSTSELDFEHMKFEVVKVHVDRGG